MSRSDDIEVHLDSLRRGGDSIGGAAIRLAEAWTAHAQRVAAMGDIFGSDPIGGLIGTSYHAAHQIAERSYESVVSSLASFNRGLHAAADTFDRNKAAQVDRVRGLRRQLREHPDLRPLG
jgi:hypothetical protein